MRPGRRDTRNQPDLTTNGYELSRIRPDQASNLRSARSSSCEARHARHAADTLHIAATVTRSKTLRGAADCYDRAARMSYGRVPQQTHEGRQLRSAARLLALTGSGSRDGVRQLVRLVANLAALTMAVAELRQAQGHAAQAAAARAAAMRLRMEPDQVAAAATWYARSQALLAAAPGQKHGNACADVTPGPGQPPIGQASRSRPPAPPGIARRPAGR